MTDLAEHLKGVIRAGGPISIAEFMRLALTARADSYYRGGEPLGAKGDFVTAPEISQIFGELIGLWCVDLWHKLGAPARFTLVELGPGRGTLMQDALRAARLVPAFLNAAAVALVEVSETLRAQQRAALQDAAVASLRWHERFEDVASRGPTIVVANEFFDALPIRQFVRVADGWVERCVGLDRDGGLMFGASPGVVDPDLIPQRLRQSAIGAMVEISPARFAAAEEIGERITGVGGAVLAIDYGYAGPATGDTLQATKAHAYVDVLAQPGGADLTSHVDFAALGQAFAQGGAHVCTLATQGEFLNRLRAGERVEVLKRNATAEQRDLLDAAYRRLTAADAMGSLFKVLCAVSPAAIQPAGFQ